MSDQWMLRGIAPIEMTIDIGGHMARVEIPGG
jgi:hypothetical protein